MRERIEADLDHAKRAEDHRRVDVAHMGDAERLAGEIADADAQDHAAVLLAVALQRLGIVAVDISTVVTVFGALGRLDDVEAERLAFGPDATARRTASASRRWRRKTFSSPSSNSMSSGLAQREQQVLRRRAGIFLVVLARLRARSSPNRACAGPAVLCTSRARSLAATKPRPGGVIRPFCEPDIATSTPHASISKGMQPSEATASTMNSADGRRP